MVFKVVRSGEGDRDLELIFDHLVESYMEFGDPLPDAFDRAHRRMATIEADMDSLALAPHQGTLRNQIKPGLRQVTKNQTVFYFHVDNTARTIRVLAVFFGGQDHLRRVVMRLSRM